MKVTRNFKCTNKECNHISNRFLDSEIVNIVCPMCGVVANKMLSAPKCFSNTTGASPSASKFKY